MKQTTYDVVGLGHPILDLTFETSDEFLAEQGFGKGEMYLVDEAKSHSLPGDLSYAKHHGTAGGSAANTLACVSYLGGKTLLVGKVGKDGLGSLYTDLVHADGVETDVRAAEVSQGICKVFTTPDTERTFATYLGASQTLSKKDLDYSKILDTKIIHLEGFLLDSAKDVVYEVVEKAKEHNILVSLDLADVGVIERHRSDLEKLLVPIDIVFANEAETQAYTGKSFEESIDIMRDLVDLNVLKRGKRGSTLVRGDEMVHVPVYDVVVKNANGAGDAYAGGLLWSYLQGHDLETMGKIAAYSGAKAVESLGARVEDPKFKEQVLEL